MSMYPTPPVCVGYHVLVAVRVKDPPYLIRFPEMLVIPDSWSIPASESQSNEIPILIPAWKKDTQELWWRGLVSIPAHEVEDIPFLGPPPPPSSLT